MPLLPRRHAAFETGSQIGIIDFVEGGDDLLLGGVCRFHFVLCGHAAIYVARNSEPGFQRICGRLCCRRAVPSWLEAQSGAPLATAGC